MVVSMSFRMAENSRKISTAALTLFTNHNNIMSQKIDNIGVKENCIAKWKGI